MDSTQFSYTLEGDETGTMRHTHSHTWLLDDSGETPAMPEGMERYFTENRDKETTVTVTPISSSLNSFRVMPSGEIRYTCPCCGGDTKRQEGLCGRCLI